MSHIVQIQTQVRDSAAVQAACRRLDLAGPVQGTFDVFGTEVTGLGVRLPDWDYPIVCDTTTGKVQFDNYNGAWGDQKELDRFMQAYAVEKAKIEARKKGHSVTEQPLADGSIKLTVNLGGAA
jgi:hypothetical protein